MTIGIMEVLLVGARGLKNNEFFGQGGNPVWNEKFTFSVEYPSEEEDERYKLILNIMDKDTFSADDYLGQATIYLEDLLALGVENGNAKLHPLKYSVVSPDQNYCGEIQVGVTFTPKVQEEEEAEEEEFGGWKESDY
ncbi:elicitor-responsive protein 1 isoform X2 [Camellia sinensis]|uniref:elicitor-responsive protein 1 isoform X2 n=1 Tax=Camellia sinensis TaxID=4442 RepID=UPI0010360809|nr:elicitor-responsive protein 1 isoform X2 [Camellia sinensis]